MPPKLPPRQSPREKKKNTSFDPRNPYQYSASQRSHTYTGADENKGPAPAHDVFALTRTPPRRSQRKRVPKKPYTPNKTPVKRAPKSAAEVSINPVSETESESEVSINPPIPQHAPYGGKEPKSKSKPSGEAAISSTIINQNPPPVSGSERGWGRTLGKQMLHQQKLDRIRSLKSYFDASRTRSNVSINYLPPSEQQTLKELSYFDPVTRKYVFYGDPEYQGDVEAKVEYIKAHLLEGDRSGFTVSFGRWPEEFQRAYYEHIAPFWNEASKTFEFPMASIVNQEPINGQELIDGPEEIPEAIPEAIPEPAAPQPSQMYYAVDRPPTPAPLIILGPSTFSQASTVIPNPESQVFSAMTQNPRPLSQPAPPAPIVFAAASLVGYQSGESQSSEHSEPAFSLAQVKARLLKRKAAEEAKRAAPERKQLEEKIPEPVVDIPDDMDMGPVDMGPEPEVQDDEESVKLFRRSRKSRIGKPSQYRFSAAELKANRKSRGNANRESRRARPRQIPNVPNRPALTEPRLRRLPNPRGRIPGQNARIQVRPQRSGQHLPDLITLYLHLTPTQQRNLLYHKVIRLQPNQMGFNDQVFVRNRVHVLLTQQQYADIVHAYQQQEPMRLQFDARQVEMHGQGWAAA